MSLEFPPSDRRGGGASLPRAGYLLLAGLTLFWGANWPVMKFILEELPVWWFRSACVVVGGVGLLLIARLSGLSLAVPRAERGPLLLCALFNVVGWHLCSAYGLSLMPAGRAIIVAFTMPVWASLLGSLVLGEALTRSKLIGLALGMAGLAVLIGPDLADLGAAPLGAMFMILAAVSWASGTVAIKRFTWSVPTTALVGWQLMAGAVPLTIGAVLLEPAPELGALGRDIWIALAYVFLFPHAVLPVGLFHDGAPVPGQRRRVRHARHPGGGGLCERPDAGRDGGASGAERPRADLRRADRRALRADAQAHHAALRRK